MRISGLKSKDNKNNIVSNIKVNRNKVDNLNSEIDNKFSDKSKKELKELLDSIKRRGIRWLQLRNTMMLSNTKDWLSSI